MQHIKTRIGSEPIYIGAAQYQDFPLIVVASYFAPPAGPTRRLRDAEGKTVGDVLAQAYQDLA